MKESVVLLFPIFFPILAGVVLFCLPKRLNRKFLKWYLGTVLIQNFVILLHTILLGEISYTAFVLMDKLPIFFHIDALGIIFALVISVVWVGIGFFALGYMKHEQNEKIFFGFYLMSYGVLLGIVLAGNLITLYGFYELVTLLTLPLVMHTRTKEAVMAGLKYLFYSLCGAYMALFGMFFLHQYAETLTFQGGGTLDMTLVSGNEGILLVGIFLMIIGFGVKAGMFPFHGWLPTAHPVAPSPASAVLSAIVVKAGVFAIIRVVYYIVGPDFIRGTWVQYTWLILALITIFLGSMLAYNENIIKKRLAYSTVSQVSYILFGLALLNPVGFAGAILHTIFHAFIKSTLFLVAGCIIYKTKKNRVDELVGIGKEMPITIGCYTLASLALIGIPLTSGFISKWYLGTASLVSGISTIAWLGPVILLISALLTAGYLLPIMINGFFPGEHFDYQKVNHYEPNKFMLIPLVFFAFIAIVFGLFPNEIIKVILLIASEVL